MLAHKCRDERAFSRRRRTTRHVSEAWETGIAKSLPALFGTQLFDQAVQTGRQRQLLVWNRRLCDVQFLQRNQLFEVKTTCHQLLETGSALECPGDSEIARQIMRVLRGTDAPCG